MASIIDSFRETFSDNYAFPKLLVFAVPLYFSYDLYMKSNNNYTAFTWLFSITLFFLFGFLVKVTSGVLNERNSVLPPLNPFQLALASTKGLIAIAPSAAVAILAADYFSSLINILAWVDITLKSVIWLLVVSIILTSFLMFVRREKITDAYNMKTLSDKAADLMVSLIFFILQLVIANVFTTAFIGYVILILFGVGPVLYFYVSLAVAFNIGVMGHYLAQLQYEILGYDRENF